MAAGRGENGEFLVRRDLLDKVAIFKPNHRFKTRNPHIWNAIRTSDLPDLIGAQVEASGPFQQTGSIGIRELGIAG